LAGKLAGRGSLNAVAPGKLVHIMDDISNRRFLVDTGASFSIFPHHSSSPASGPSLTGPGGQPIKCWGERRLSLLLHGRRFEWTFLLAAVTFPIIGVDFLIHHCLLVDPAANRLVDRDTQQTLPTVAAVSAVASVPDDSADAAAPLPSTRLYPGLAPLRAAGYGPASASPTGPAPSTPARLYPVSPFGRRKTSGGQS